jgi:CheY-like chemotaxis protein
MSVLEQLAGRRILVVEDEALIAMLAEDMLAELGCVVLGPAMNVAAAMALLAHDQPVDVALLDLNLNGESVYPVADVLRQRGVPLVICTGNGVAGLGEVEREALVLQKPYRSVDLAAALTRALAKA